MKRILPAVAVIGACLSASPAQVVTNITQAGLGYPVPLPVESLTPVAGFRSAASLRARFLDLELGNDDITETQTGSSLNGRAIYSYRFQHNGPNTFEGIPKSAALVQGTIHAREWISPEVVARLYEWLALEGDSDPVAAYVLDSTTIVIHPVGNPDSFALTQAYPSQTVDGNSSGSSGVEGRMRRKNLRSADQTLATTADHRQGVDLNRNHAFGFGNGSATPTSIIYHGTAPGSEPETTALYAAATLLDETRFRFFCDVHSYEQVYYLIFDGDASRNAAVVNAYNLMRGATLATSGASYGRIDVELATEAEGATDEYFTGTYGCLSYTLEVRPPSAVNGFILPDSQVDIARNELLQAFRAGLYYAAGPATMVRIRIYDTTDGRNESSPLVYEQVRGYAGGTRTLGDITNESLLAGHLYTAVLQFNKPMRIKDSSTGAPRFLPGATGDMNGTISIAGLVSASNAEWQFDTNGGNFGFSHFSGDTLTVDFDLRSANAPDDSHALSVAMDDALSQAIDGDPRTVADWSPQGWLNWDGMTSANADTHALVQFQQPPHPPPEVWILY
ncbi:hypothetical protein IT570_10005 [Candidatus Sumerlaeota bacterium]|nr:hypothetical protein [Candidatus Sumerlaeota bacterium]